MEGLWRIPWRAHTLLISLPAWRVVVGGKARQALTKMDFSLCTPLYPGARRCVILHINHTYAVCIVWLDSECIPGAGRYSQCPPICMDIIPPYRQQPQTLPAVCIAGRPCAYVMQQAPCLCHAGGPKAPCLCDATWSKKMEQSGCKRDTARPHVEQLSFEVPATPCLLSCIYSYIERCNLVKDHLTSL